jgi:hypothetical protein
MGILRVSESLGSTFPYKVGSESNLSLLRNLLVAAIVFWITVPSTTFTAWLVPEVPLGEKVESDDEESSVENVTIVVNEKIM